MSIEVRTRRERFLFSLASARTPPRVVPRLATGTTNRDSAVMALLQRAKATDEHNREHRQDDDGQGSLRSTRNVETYPSHPRSRRRYRGRVNRVKFTGPRGAREGRDGCDDGQDDHAKHRSHLAVASLSLSARTVPREEQKTGIPAQRPQAALYPSNRSFEALSEELRQELPGGKV